MQADYLPLNLRRPDSQYQDMLRSIMEHGVQGESQQEVDAISLPHSWTLRYVLANGAPVITERKISGFAPKAIAELFEFLNGTRTLAGLEAAGCNWWSAWATEEKCRKRGLETGDLGPGSYGAAYHDFPMPDGRTFNQLENVVAQIKERPHLRTHMMTTWVPFYNFRNKGNVQKVVVSPCHGTVVKWKVFGDRLIMQHVQRSGDCPVGVPSNMVQYTALFLAVAQVTGLTPWIYEHIILEPHIFVDQTEAVKEILGREPRRLPKLVITDEKKTDIFAFGKDDFAILEYDPHPGIPGIPVAT
jgi:thymidylate synthase